MLTSIFAGVSGGFYPVLAVSVEDEQHRGHEAVAADFVLTGLQRKSSGFHQQSFQDQVSLQLAVGGCQPGGQDEWAAGGCTQQDGRWLWCWGVLEMFCSDANFSAWALNLGVDKWEEEAGEDLANSGAATSEQSLSLPTLRSQPVTLSLPHPPNYHAPEKCPAQRFCKVPQG